MSIHASRRNSNSTSPIKISITESIAHLNYSLFTQFTVVINHMNMSCLCYSYSTRVRDKKEIKLLSPIFQYHILGLLNICFIILFIFLFTCFLVYIHQFFISLNHTLLNHITYNCSAWTSIFDISLFIQEKSLMGSLFHRHKANSTI